MRGVGQLALVDLAPQLADRLERPLERLRHSGLDALGVRRESPGARRSGVPEASREGESTLPSIPTEVESQRSRPSVARRSSAASVTSRVSGPHSSREEAKAIIP